MTSSASISKYVRRVLSSLLAIAAVSVIFGAKAYESHHIAKAQQTPSITLNIAK